LFLGVCVTTLSFPPVSFIVSQPALLASSCLRCWDILWGFPLAFSLFYPSSFLRQFIWTELCPPIHMLKPQPPIWLYLQT
jgi:hypothetical protein